MADKVVVRNGLVNALDFLIVQDFDFNCILYLKNYLIAILVCSIGQVDDF